mgnify:CR=1 FL=1|jgi:uncharacterized protein YfaQ (DUF2300 family)
MEYVCAGVLSGVVACWACCATPPSIDDANAKERRYGEHWATVRSHVRVRACALYWQEQTQIRTCADGGRGREEDASQFRRDLLEMDSAPM